MSLTAPNPIVHSKCYFFLKQHLQEEEFKELIPKLPNFPVFRLKVLFRNLESVETIDYTDNEIIEFITGTEEFSKMNKWNCSDIALNMFTRLKKPLAESLGEKKGVISYYIQASYDNGEKYNDMFCDDVLLTRNNKDVVQTK